MRFRDALRSFAIAVLIAGPAAAQGIVIPVEPDLPPLALESHRVSVEIVDHGATTKIEQVILNNTARQLEAQYGFPVPTGAVLTRFTMIVGGKEKAGELVQKDKAREIYNSIVQRSQDPGLLEMIGRDLFRANIFPIEPRSKQTITVRFQQIAPSEAGLVEYLYPVLTSSGRDPTVQGTFGIEVVLRSQAPIRNVYSPSHPVLVARAGEHEAHVSFEAEQATLEKDFQLFYGTSKEDVGLSLVAHRVDAAQPGYFLLLVSPRSELQAERIVDRDVVFVVDTSGSMNGPKIEQAKKALAYCVSRLNDGDRFNIVEFNTEVEPWKDEMVGAAEGRAAALKYVETIVAQGGTNIAGAIDAALSFPRDPSRPYFVVFMTDGKPTLGETTDPKKILGKVEKARADESGQAIRIFTWGVGYDLDTQLLDSIAASSGGVAEYVRPEEDIAAKVSSFYEKTSHPVLTDLRLELVGDAVQLANVYPRDLPDLYAGGQLVLIGRYTGDGATAVRLTGQVNGKAETFTYECDFPGRREGQDFIEPLWAKRRIGHLLEAIRLNGESKELVDDVIRLSKEYGIQTPYTSWLILEDGMQVPADPARSPQAALPDDMGGRGVFAARPMEDAEARDLAKKLDEFAPPGPSGGGAAGEQQRWAAAPEAEEKRREHNELAESLGKGFASRDGKSAVDAATYLRSLKETDRDGGDLAVAPFRKAAGSRFFAYKDMWVDERFDAAAAVTTVRFGSKAYFRLLELHPELVDALKIGRSVVCWTKAGRALAVCESAGDEELSDEAIEALFR